MCDAKLNAMLDVVQVLRGVSVDLKLDLSGLCTIQAPAWQGQGRKEETKAKEDAAVQEQSCSKDVAAISSVQMGMKRGSKQWPVQIRALGRVPPIQGLRKGSDQGLRTGSNQGLGKDPNQGHRQGASQCPKQLLSFPWCRFFLMMLEAREKHHHHLHLLHLVLVLSKGALSEGFIAALSSRGT